MFLVTWTITAGLILLCRRYGEYMEERRQATLPENIYWEHLKQAEFFTKLMNFSRAEESLNLAETALTGMSVPARLYIKRAHVRLARRNLQGMHEDLLRSEALLKSASELFAGDYLLRAEMRLHLKQYEAAKEDLQKSRKFDPRAENLQAIAVLQGVLLYCQGDMAGAARSWNEVSLDAEEPGCNLRWCALARMGAEAGATRELKARAKGTFSDRNMPGEWNRMISKFLLGRVTKERLLEFGANDRLSEGEIALRRCQACFFIAASYMSWNREEALFQLNACLATEQMSVYEYAMASADLERLATFCI